MPQNMAAVTLEKLKSVPPAYLFRESAVIALLSAALFDRLNPEDKNSCKNFAYLIDELYLYNSEDSDPNHPPTEVQEAISELANAYDEKDEEAWGVLVQKAEEFTERWMSRNE